jgi:hypothetical protein
MPEEWTVDRWEDALRAVFRRALTDVAFRELALADARAAFTQANGAPPPPRVKSRFAESLEESVFVLPKAIVPQGTLSEIDIARILHHSLRQQAVAPAGL